MNSSEVGFVVLQIRRNICLLYTILEMIKMTKNREAAPPIKPEMVHIMSVIQYTQLLPNCKTLLRLKLSCSSFTYCKNLLSVMFWSVASILSWSSLPYCQKLFSVMFWSVSFLLSSSSSMHLKIWVTFLK